MTMEETQQTTGNGRACKTCVLHHPERLNRPCSALGRCVTHDNCAAYIEDKPINEVEAHD